jgi:hypothetical protein
MNGSLRRAASWTNDANSDERHGRRTLTHRGGMTITVGKSKTLCNEITLMWSWACADSGFQNVLHILAREIAETPALPPWKARWRPRGAPLPCAAGYVSVTLFTNSRLGMIWCQGRWLLFPSTLNGLLYYYKRRIDDDNCRNSCYHLPIYVSLTCGGYMANNRHFQEKCGKS